MGNPAALSLGPGIIKIADIGTAEPTDLASAWPAGWQEPGYTENGSVFGYESTLDEVEVEEEFDPVAFVTTKRSGSLSFKMAELTATHLKWALNGGTITAGAGYVYYDPPAPGTEVWKMLGFQADDLTERWIFRRCFQGGKVEVPRRKGNNKALIPVEFRLAKPAGLQPWRAILVSPGRA
jgi:hypothetical protein